MLFGFPRVPSPAPGLLGFGARVGAQDTSAPEFRAFPRVRSVFNPPAVPGAPARSPSSGRRPPPGSGPVQLKLVSHEPRGSGNPGSGRGRARQEGAAQSTYMRRALLTDARNSQ